MHPHVTGVTQTSRSGCWGDGWVRWHEGFASTYCPLDSTHCDSSGACPIWMTDLAAPGGGEFHYPVHSDEPLVACAEHDSCYQGDSGTSLAAPLVAGVGVYLKDRAKARGITLYPEDIEGLLCATTDSVRVMNSDGTCSEDFFDSYPNTYCGWGKINAYEAAKRIYYSDPDPERGQSTTLARFTDTGYDTCWQYGEFELADYPAPGDTSTFYRYRLRKAIYYEGVSFGDPPFAWGYWTGYANEGSIADPFNYNLAPTADTRVVPDHMKWKWSGVIPSSMTAQGCTLESFLWCMRSNGSADSTWVTVSPDSMVWGCGVSGRHFFSEVQEGSSASRLQSLTVGPSYPNPFNPTTTITFALPRPEHVTIRIYDVQGRHVRVLGDERMGAGEHQLEWDGRDARGRVAASGVYFLRVEAAGSAETRKMILTK